jgi:hypothetical protein
VTYRPPLPDFLVETLFAQLMLAWGAPFREQYKGLEPATVKAHWAQELAGFYQPEIDPSQDQAPAVTWALAHLPPKPMNVIEFRRLCGQYLANPPAALPAPRGRLELPPEVAEKFQNLRAPRPEEEPAQVRRARDTLSRLENRKASELSTVHLECMTAAKSLIERWEKTGVLPT